MKAWPTQKPTVLGFRTDLWSSRRLVDLIRRHFAVDFHPASLRRWLRERDYTPQRPAKKARQRNDAAIAGWVKTEWPRIQKKRPRPASTSC